MDFISFYSVIKWMLSSTSWDPDLYQIWSLIWDGLLPPTPPRETSHRSTCNWPQQVFWSRPELTALFTRSSLQAHGQRRNEEIGPAKWFAIARSSEERKLQVSSTRRQLIQGTESHLERLGHKARRGSAEWGKRWGRWLDDPGPWEPLARSLGLNLRVSRSQWWAPARGKIVHILISEGCFWLQGKSRIGAGKPEVGR